MKPVAIAIAGIALACLVGPADAAFSPTYCSDGSPHLDNLSVADMTYEGAAANDCYGVVGGNVNSDADLYALDLDWTRNSESPFSMIGDAPAGGSSVFEYEGLRFTLSSGTGTSSTWTLTAIDINGADELNLPAELTFIVALKASDRFALWYFHPAIVDGWNQGTFEIVFENHGRQIPDLSHLVVFADPPGIPEPGALALLALGLVGLGLQRRHTAAA